MDSPRGQRQCRRMKPPPWFIGEDLEDPAPIDNYLVRLTPPRIIAKATQKRGAKLMLTVQSQPKEGEHLKSWYSQLHQAARFWAEAVNDSDYDHEPEILVNPAFTPPRFILADNQQVNRVFIVHSGEPFFGAELVDRQPLLIAGEESALGSDAWTNMCRLVGDRHDFH